MSARELSRRAAGLAFWIGLPLTLLAVPLWPRGSVLVVGDDPFSLELNPVRSSLPPPFDELSFFYPATLAGLGVLALATMARPWWGRRYRVASVMDMVCYVGFKNLLIGAALFLMLKSLGWLTVSG